VVQTLLKPRIGVVVVTPVLAVRGITLLIHSALLELFISVHGDSSFRRRRSRKIKSRLLKFHWGVKEKVFNLAINSNIVMRFNTGHRPEYCIISLWISPN
jgi:hypothetical protein